MSLVDSSMSPWPQLTHTARNAEKCACRTSGDAFCRYAITLEPAQRSARVTSSRPRPPRSSAQVSAAGGRGKFQRTRGADAAQRARFAEMRCASFSLCAESRHVGFHSGRLRPASLLWQPRSAGAACTRCSALAPAAFAPAPSQVTQEELESEVKRFGPTSNVWVAKNPAGFAFVVRPLSLHLYCSSPSPPAHR